MDAASIQPDPTRPDDADGPPGAREAAAGRSTGPPRLTALRELQLVEAHKEGDPEAIAALLRAYQHRVYAVCFQMVRNADEASDLTQDALIKVMEGLHSFDGRAAPSTWVIRVTMNCCLSHLRRQRLRRHASLEQSGPPEGQSWSATLPDREPSAIRRVEQAEMRSALLRALRGLDPPMRAMLVLRDLQELEYQQIGEILGVPLGTVKSRLFRARAALREAVELEMAEREDQGPTRGEAGDAGE